MDPLSYVFHQQQQKRQNARNIGQGVGDIFAMKNRAGFERSAVDVLKDGVTPEKLQQLSQMYPNLPQQVIWKYGAEVGKQREAQDVKDAGKAFIEWYKSTPSEERNSKGVQKFFESLNVSPGTEQALFKQMPQLLKFIKSTQPEEELVNLGGQGSVLKEDGKFKRNAQGNMVVMGAPGPDKPTYRVMGGNIYKIEDGKSSILQKGSIDEKAVTNAMHDPEWEFADEITQAELIQKHTRFLKGNTKGREKPSTKQGGYKTADDVKAAYSAGTIKKEEALKILREQFGMK